MFPLLEGLFGEKKSAPSSALFSPLKVQGLELKNRLVVSPMCMYSAVSGLAGDFHLVHYGALALGGAGLIFTEAVAVTPEGRISPEDLGLWNDEQKDSLSRIVDFAHEQGAKMGIQLAHAGRKASSRAPQRGHGALSPEEGGWDVVAPSALAHSEHYATPRAMTPDDIAQTVQAFAAAARRAMLAGFDVLEIHAAHGYLLHQFLSPLSNDRTDDYGGDLENRSRFLLEVVRAVRAEWPNSQPLFVRLSATDWAAGGWDIEETVSLAKALRREGVDVIDVSSGGLSAQQDIALAPNYQVPFAARIRQEADIKTMAVGLITEPLQAEAIVQNEQADLVAIGREMLRDPHFPQRAAQALGAKIEYPSQYVRAQGRQI